MNSDHAELKTLKEEYLNARRALSRVKSGTRRRELTEYINDLKIELGWNLLDYGKYEQGFALFESLSWRGYGDVKCNGMARALTEMGDYDGARKLLEVGLKKFPKSYALWVAKGILAKVMMILYFSTQICMLRASLEIITTLFPSLSTGREIQHI